MLQHLLKKTVIAIVLVGSILGCSQIPKNEIEGITFSFNTYVNEDGTTIPKGQNDPEFYEVEDPNLGFFKGVIWNEIKLTNHNENESTFVIANNDKLNPNYSLYVDDTTGEGYIQISPVKAPGYGDGRSFQFPGPNFQVDMKPNSTRYFYLYSTSDGRVVQTTPFIISVQDYMRLMNRETYANGLFYGSLLIIFIVNLFLWASFKNKIHGFYSFYVLFNLIIFLGFDGYLFGHGIEPLVIDHLVFIGLRGCVLCLVLFTSYFLKINEISPKFHFWIKRLCIISIALITGYQLVFFHSSIGYLHSIENLLTCAWMITVLIMLVISQRLKRREVRYYVVALFFYLFFVIIGVLTPHIGWISNLHFQFSSFYKIGVLLEVIIFTYTIIAVLKFSESTHRKKNEEIQLTRENIESENKELKNQIKNSNMQKMEFLSILKLIESNLNDEQEWTTFKDKVNEVNPTFLKNLQGAHQNLSKTDLRLLLLVKLGFTQKEIAGMLFIAEGSVKKSKQRVRKKLSLSAEVTLSEYLSKL